jgi:hypothetical protein
MESEWRGHQFGFTTEGWGRHPNLSSYRGPPIKATDYPNLHYKAPYVLCYGQVSSLDAYGYKQEISVKFFGMIWNIPLLLSQETDHVSVMKGSENVRSSGNILRPILRICFRGIPGWDTKYSEIFPWFSHSWHRHCYSSSIRTEPLPSRSFPLYSSWNIKTIRRLLLQTLRRR